MFRNYFGIVILITTQGKERLGSSSGYKHFKKASIVGALVYHACYSAIIMMTII